MTESSSPPPADASFRSAITRYAAAAVGLIVGVAALFWVIGSFGGDDDDTPEIADGPMTDVGRELEDQQADDDEEADQGSDDDAGDEEGGDGADAGDGDDAAGEPTDDGNGTDDTGSDDGPDDEGAGTDDEDAGDTDDGGGASAPRIDPATITVQVLDGYQQDGGAAADAVAELLEAEGYDIIARNPALRYEETTVLWTAGSEAAGQQVAAAIDAAEAREQPGNLSSEVDVHVVVGADRS